MRVLVGLVAACACAYACSDASGIESPSFVPDDDAASTATSPIADAANDANDAADANDSSESWARYVIDPGTHHASVVPSGAGKGDPLRGLVSGTNGRTFDLALDTSAQYVLTNPTQPEDQLDWNKLPGLSDCGTFDLAEDGLMFGWRWRIDVTPSVLEVTAYANNARKHLTPPAPLFTLDADDLATATPIRYELAMDGAFYRFAASATVRGRTIDAKTTLPRRCSETSPSTLSVQWAAGLYFGGTSTAPSTITASIFEHVAR